MHVKNEFADFTSLSFKPVLCHLLGCIASKGLNNMSAAVNSYLWINVSMWHRINLLFNTLQPSIFGWLTLLIKTILTCLQPVQGFDYAKKHLGRTGDEAVSVTKETLVLGLPVRDAPLSMSLDKKVLQDGTGSKRPPSADIKGGYGCDSHVCPCLCFSLHGWGLSYIQCSCALPKSMDLYFSNIPVCKCMDWRNKYILYLALTHNWLLPYLFLVFFFFFFLAVVCWSSHCSSTRRQILNELLRPTIAWL